MNCLKSAMASRKTAQEAKSFLTRSRPGGASFIWQPRVSARCVHQSTRLPAMAASNSRTRPTLQPFHQPSNMLKPASIGGSRSIFIQTEDTPNPDALKFLPNHPILPPNLSSPFIEYLNPRSTLAPPHPSPLAAQLMNIDGIKSVFYGADFITVTKAEDANWAHIKPEVFSLITEAVTSGAQIVTTVESSGAHGEEEEDSLSYNENDSEVVGMIKELLETRIRPAIQEDGGDIDYRGFEDGMVLLKLRGACRTCDSSTVTLKNGIEGMLMHYIEEVKGVVQVMDEEEEVAMREFAKFEEKLRQQKGPDATASTVGKGSLDTVPG
ncbi:HIRA-interacting 5 protein [Rutstroemia sp. NJR-2017a BVV2]|nr:HIRA-interacting 5 protein [Rutstroemia sp. NJR-2017a BVV2]